MDDIFISLEFVIKIFTLLNLFLLNSIGSFLNEFFKVIKLREITYINIEEYIKMNEYILFVKPWKINQ